MIERLREFIEDLKDELEWDALFERTQPKLVAAARKARKEVAEGQACDCLTKNSLQPPELSNKRME